MLILFWRWAVTSEAPVPDSGGGAAVLAIDANALSAVVGVRGGGATWGGAGGGGGRGGAVPADEAIDDCEGVPPAV